MEQGPPPTARTEEEISRNLRLDKTACPGISPYKVLDLHLATNVADKHRQFF